MEADLPFHFQLAEIRTQRNLQTKLQVCITACGGPVDKLSETVTQGTVVDIGQQAFQCPADRTFDIQHRPGKVLDRGNSAIHISVENGGRVGRDTHGPANEQRRTCQGIELSPQGMVIKQHIVKIKTHFKAAVALVEWHMIQRPLQQETHIVHVPAFERTAQPFHRFRAQHPVRKIRRNIRDRNSICLKLHIDPGYCLSRHPVELQTRPGLKRA